MTAPAQLIEALVAAYEPHVRSRLAHHGLPIPEGFEGSIEEGRRWLRSQLETLLSLPFARQARGPLEVFQEAMRFPTEVLAAEGVEEIPRDEVTANALPGDRYHLAPASSAELGEDVWQAHLAWGAAKARAMTGH